MMGLALGLWRKAQETAFPRQPADIPLPKSRAESTCEHATPASALYYRFIDSITAGMHAQAERKRMEEFYNSLMGSVSIGWGRDRHTGKYHSQFAKNAWAAWQAAKETP